MPAIRAKISGLATIRVGSSCASVITADVRVADQVQRYVLIGSLEAMRLYHLAGHRQEVQPDALLPEVPGVLAGNAFALPEGYLREGGTLAQYAAASLVGGETRWVHIAYARPLLERLETWRALHAPPPGASFHAPDWHSLTAVRLLAIAAGMPDPAVGETVQAWRD